MKSRIIVIGSPGGGKSRFSKSLSEITGIPVFHLDNIYWKADRTHISREELTAEVEKVMKGEAWIIDGNYMSTMEQRLTGAEAVFYLDFSTEQCLAGIRHRVGVRRDDIPWVEEKLDSDFERWVAEFRDEVRPRILGLLEKYGDKEITRFVSREEADAFLENLRGGAGRF